MTALALEARRRREAAPSPPDRLRQLAARVARLGVASRLDPEVIYIEKADIERSLRRLANELEAAP